MAESLHFLFELDIAIFHEPQGVSPGFSAAVSKNRG
jgi:hypothetical protein